MLTYKVTVIIPVYKAANYIERCARSLFGQTLREIEYIFVDDCSPDDSVDIIRNVLEEYPYRHNDVKIIRHEYNKGVGTSRSDGLAVATGEYVIHADPDDWVELDMYEKMFNTANSAKSDMVICDYWMEFKSSRTIRSFNLLDVHSAVLLTKLVRGQLHGGLCNKLIQRKKIEDIGAAFIPGLNICEDQTFCIQMFQSDLSVSYIGEPLYHYDKFSNPNSLTLLSTSYGSNQLNLWQDAIERFFIKDVGYDYRTAITYIAYWCFTHQIISSVEYRRRYGKHRLDILRSGRSLGIKLVTLLASCGFNNPLWWTYSRFKGIKR